MIVRVLNMKVKPGRVGQFNTVIRQQLPTLREQAGLVYVKLARRLDAEGGEEVILFEEWRYPDSLYAWTGSDLSAPRLPATAEAELVDVTVTHYESLDVDMDRFEETAPGERDVDRASTTR